MTACPCCSGLSYAECCQPYHQEKALPPTAEALMRSRYSAFALKQVDHLWRTLHPDHPDAKRPRGDVIRSVKKLCNRCTFPRLTILSAPPSDGNVATVTFRATILDGNADVGFTETSTFEKVAGQWRYRSGVVESG